MPIQKIGVHPKDSWFKTRYFKPLKVRNDSNAKPKLGAETLRLQGYLAHKKQPLPQDHRRALGIVLL